MARDAPDSLSLSVWWTVTGWSVCICQILSVCICFTIFVWIYLQISPQLAGWCKRDGFRNIAEAIASFAKWIVPLFQNCINTSFKSNTNFRENICFFLQWCYWHSFVLWMGSWGPNSEELDTILTVYGEHQLDGLWERYENKVNEGKV